MHRASVKPPSEISTYARAVKRSWVVAAIANAKADEFAQLVRVYTMWGLLTYSPTGAGGGGGGAVNYAQGKC